MKKILIPSLLASFLFASEQNFVEFGGGYIKSKDNFSTESTKNIANLGSAKAENSAIPYINFFYGYDLNESMNIYVSSDRGGFHLGSSMDTNYGLFDFGLKAETGEEWENPFLTGSNRKETDTKEFGGYFAYGIPLAENIETTIRYEFSKKSYDKDNVVSDLKRDGKRHNISLESVYMTNLFNRNAALISNLSYEKYDADGEASSYDRYDLELGVSSRVSENVKLTLLGSLGKKEYQKINPELNKKIDVDIYGVFAEAKWNKPLNYQNTYVSFKTGYEKEEANDKFYDKENALGIVSVGYRF